MPHMYEPVLSIESLNLEFPVYKSTVKALNGVSLHVAPGEVVGVVGESGSGKSVTAMATLQLLPRDAHNISSGAIKLLGRNVLTMSEAQLQSMRGRDAAMIFQEPMTALNPTQRVGRQLIDVIRRHQPLSVAQARSKAVGLLKDMYISDPEQTLNRYPFELSGGMRQRVMIALAFSCEPKLLIADEPTTALDVTVQRQVLLLLREKARERGTSILFITHDMAVVSQFCDRVYVMYAGAVVEHGPTTRVMTKPAHPYTRALLLGLPENAAPRGRLQSIAGQVPDLSDLPQGCAFRDRCELASDYCLIRPSLQPASTTGLTESAHQAACWHADMQELANARHP